MHRSTSLALLLPALCQASSFVPNTRGPLEIDLIYPRNLTISSKQAVPIVFAIQNPLVANDLSNIEISWKVFPLDQPTNYSAPGAQQFTTGLGFSNTSIPSPYFDLFFLSNLIGIKGQYVFSWAVNVSDCADTGNRDLHIGDGGSVIFTTSKSGPTPDLSAAAAAGTCDDTQNVAFNVSGYYTNTTDNMHCGKLGGEFGTELGNPCAVKINSSTASAISAQILASVCAVDYVNTTRLNISCSSVNHTSGAVVGFAANSGVLAIAGLVALAVPLIAAL